MRNTKALVEVYKGEIKVLTWTDGIMNSVLFDRERAQCLADDLNAAIQKLPRVAVDGDI